MSSGISGGGSNSNFDATNISISKTMHLHSIEKSSDDAIVDEIVDASTSDYQAEYIPPASNPSLESSDPQASDQQPSSDLSPQSDYLDNVESSLHNLPSSLLSSLGNGNSLTGLNKLIYSFNHPEANVDSQVKNLTEQIKAQALAKTQNSLGLGSNWKPDPPKTGAADAQFAEDYNSAFENLVNKSDLSNDDAASVTYYHYHPEDVPTDDPLKQDVENFENAAFSSVAEKEGYPADMAKPTNSNEYDTKVAKFYNNAFTQHMNDDPETKDLSKEDKAALETLHQFPDANVPNKAALTKFNQHLDQKALNDTKKAFNLPDTAKPKQSFKDFSATVLKNFQSQFNENVQHSNLTSSQQQQLMNTNGIHTHNLSPALLAAFKNIQNKTAGDIADLLGLPKDWLSATQNEAADGDTSVDEPEKDNFKEREDEKTVNNGDVNAFPKILGSNINKQKLSNVNLTTPLGTIDSNSSKMALSAMDIAKNAVAAINTRSQQYLASSKLLAGTGTMTEQNGWLSAGNYTALIASCLDTLRESVYQQQAADANSSYKIEQMSMEIAKGQQDLQSIQSQAQEQMAQTQKQPKSWTSALSNLAEATHNPFLIKLTNVFIDYVKTVSWVVDIVTGGLITTICQAAGLEDLAENPLELAGVISPQQAQTMDLVMGVIAMVAQIAIEACLGQGELIAASVESLVERVSAMAAEQGVSKIEVVVKLVGSTVKDGVLSAVKEAGNFVTKTIPRVLSSETLEAGQKMAADLVKGLQNAIKDLPSTISEEASKLASGFKENMQEMIRLGKGDEETWNKFYDAYDRLVSKRELLEQFKSGQITEMEYEEQLGKAGKGLAAQLGKNLGYLRDVVQNPSEHALEIYSLGSNLSAVASGVLTGVTSLKSGMTKQQQAVLTELLGELSSALTELDTMSKIINKTAQMMLDQLQEMVSWVGDINKQESDFFKKLPIRFVAG